MAPVKLLARMKLRGWLTIICCEVGQLFHVEQFDVRDLIARFG